MEIIQHILTGFLLVFAGIFCYMSAHCAEEMRKGKTIKPEFASPMYFNDEDSWKKIT